MATEILMPALSPTMEEGTLAKWLKKEGDAIKSGDIIAEIETDKATMEFEAVDEGTIAHIQVEEGTEGVAVGTVIATLAEDGDLLYQLVAKLHARKVLQGRSMPDGGAADRSLSLTDRRRHRRSARQPRPACCRGRGCRGRG